MAKHDLEELFSMVKAGDAVEIRDERDAQTAAIFSTGPGSPAPESVMAQNAPVSVSEPVGQ